jgi:hypothetical protein
VSGRIDLAVINKDSATVAILLGSGDGKPDLGRREFGRYIVVVLFSTFP